MRLTPFLLVASLALVPLAQATLTFQESENLVSPTTPSGEYQDGNTLVIYHYDAATGTLLPVGVAANRDGFYTIDIVGPGERPATGHSSCSATSFCVGARAMAANPEQTEHSLSVGVTTTCDDPFLGLRASFAGFAFPYDRYPGFTSGCFAPNVTATLYLDSTPMTSDQWP